MKKASVRAKRPMSSGHRGGRPSASESLQLTEHIIEIATQLFLKEGFEATSIDNLVAIAGISKRTFYLRFASKSDLFTAVVVRFTEQRLKRLNVSPAGRTPEQQLESIAVQLLRVCTEPDTVALDRVVTAEVKRFPELGRIIYDFGYPQALGPVRRVIKQIWPNNKLDETKIDYAAEYFLDAVVIGPMRRVILGLETARLSEARLAKLRFSVRLFVESMKKQIVSR